VDRKEKQAKVKMEVKGTCRKKVLRAEFRVLREKR